MRIYDPRLGRFLSVDPLASDFPWNTPYAFAENRPIDGIDFEGLEYTSYINKGEYKSVNSAFSIAENFNSFLSNVGTNTRWCQLAARSNDVYDNKKERAASSHQRY